MTENTKIKEIFKRLEQEIRLNQVLCRKSKRDILTGEYDLDEAREDVLSFKEGRGE